MNTFNAKLAFNPSNKTLREFALGLFVVSAFVMFKFMDFNGPDWKVKAVPMTILLLALAGTFFWPILLKWPYVISMFIAMPIGMIVSTIILLILFYFVFTPLGVVFRLLGKDILQLQMRGQASYWKEKQQPTDLSYYLRQ